MESKMVPYAAVSVIPCRSAIVFAPHADDEVFGCGGALALHVAAGHQVTVVVISDGAFGLDGVERTACIARRQSESRAAAAVLGYPEPSAWLLHDRGIEYGEHLVERIAKEIQEHHADLVYAPSLHEAHPDHRAVAMATVEAVRRIGSELRVAFYEIGVPLRPNILVDITTVQAIKLRAMRCFVSQLDRQRYDEQIDALNRYRAWTLPPTVTAAEAFELVSAEEISRNHLALFASEYRRLSDQGIVSVGWAEVPLVSVIIRSMGRRELVDALDSVMLQTYPNIELVVVNALGPAHEDIGNWCGRFPLRFISSGQPLGRSRAGNVGLEQARGAYLIFLDDDDWFTPDHISALVTALQRHPEAKLAYTGVTCADQDRNPIDLKYCRPFDRTRLIAGNFIPIHAALFSRVVVDLGCRMDESLDLSEDWDFWLQVGSFGDFVFLDQLSAVYRIGASSGQGSQLDPAVSRMVREKIYQKWFPSLHTDDFLSITNRLVDYERKSEELSTLQQQHAALGMSLMALEQRHDQLQHHDADLQKHSDNLQQHNSELQQRNGELQRHNSELVRHNGELQQQVHLQQAELEKLSHIRVALLLQLEDIHRSRSWRTTRPFRAAHRMAAALQRHLTPRLVLNALKAIRVEISRHGVRGFARRLPYYLKHSRTYLALLGSRPPAADGNMFSATAHSLREIRLHPDLEGGGDILDAKVSVVIPTLDAGPEFGWMLRKLRSQHGVREIEIVIVDSGSRDRTVQLAREAGAKVIEIPPSEFSHSHARNLGADAASGDYLLFMVQDAYPIGDYWMHGMLRFLLDHADEKLVAVSCAEFSRSDSDIMYDSMINTHYRFLGCLEFDRIGEFRGADHMALRSQGQLSDVSCLILRDCFSRYRYRGNYAEDLDLGIRLIKDGLRVAMLSSVKVVHSHNRPAYYYLKRSFVDVIFLVGLFDDFIYPHCESLTGLLAGVKSTAAHISSWLADRDARTSDGILAERLDEWIRLARKNLSELRDGQPVRLGDERLDEFVGAALDRYLGAGDALSSSARHNEARRFADTFLARLEHFNNFAREVYGRQDTLLRKELADVVCKTFAATAGSALAFYYLDHKAEGDAEQGTAHAMYMELVAGV